MPGYVKLQTNLVRNIKHARHEQSKRETATIPEKRGFPTNSSTGRPPTIEKFALAISNWLKKRSLQFLTSIFFLECCFTRSHFNNAQYTYARTHTNYIAFYRLLSK